MRFAILGSGSKGNALVVQAGETTIMVDAGLSPKETRRRLRTLGLELNDLTALIITHAHGDHIASAPAIAGALGLPTFCTEKTRDQCARKKVLANPALIEAGHPFKIGPLQICAFATPHDMPGSVGFVLDDESHRLGICTDLGRPDKAVGRALRDCDALVLEFNYDEEMLRTGPYPGRLKKRVAGPYGHLSNVDAAQLLALARTSLLKKVLLAHLSETNNLVRHARAAALEVVDGAEVEVAVAPQHHPTGWLGVGTARAVAPYRTPLSFVAPLAPAATRATTTSLRSAPSANRRRPRALANPALAVQKQLTLFGGSE